jgi:hypothetical protein
MQINILYVLIDDGSRKYLNQLGVSVLALRQVHPQARIRVLSDLGTRQVVTSASPKLFERIDEWIVEDCLDLPAKARGFYLKTRMCNHEKSDFVFLDADTLPIRPFYEDISVTNCDVAMVQDRNHFFPIHPQYPKHIVPNLEEMNWPTTMDKYFNTGVGFFRATKARDELVAKWQQIWWERWGKVQEPDDQLCFNVAAQKLRAKLHELPACFNAMVNVHPIHAVNARIYHFFAGNQKHFGRSLFGHLVEHFDRFQELDTRALERAKRMNYPWMPPFWPTHLWKAGMRTEAIKHFLINRIKRVQS